MQHLRASVAPTQEKSAKVKEEDELIYERDRFTGRGLEPWAHDGTGGETPEDFEPRSARGDYGDYSSETDSDFEADLSRSRNMGLVAGGRAGRPRSRNRYGSW